MTIADFLLDRIAEDLAKSQGPEEPESWCDRAEGIHHDKARAAAECEAKQRVVDDLSPYCFETENKPCGECARVGCRNLRALALSYADHPDYRASWRP